MTQPTPPQSSPQSPPTTIRQKTMRWAPDEALTESASPPPANRFNDSLEEIGEGEEAAPNQGGLWHWLEQNLPDCFMAILRWISGLFTTEAPASVELQRPAPQPSEIAAPKKTKSVLRLSKVTASEKLPKPLQQLSSAFRAAMNDWPKKKDAAKFKGCLAITVVKLTFSQGDPQIKWIEKSYDKKTRRKYADDMLEFYDSLPKEGLVTFEVCAVRCFPTLLGIEHVEATALSFNAISEKPTPRFESTLSSPLDKRDFYLTFPILQEAGVSLEELNYRVTS